MYVKVTAGGMTVHVDTQERNPSVFLKEQKKHYKIFSNIRLDIMENGCSIPLMTSIKKDGKWKNF